MTARQTLAESVGKALPRCYRYVPRPENANHKRPIERSLRLDDSNDQMTVWDARVHPDRRRPFLEPPTNAIEHLPVDCDVPEITEPGCLSHYTEYKCRNCEQFCLEPEDSEHAENTECRRCYSLPEL